MVLANVDPNYPVEQWDRFMPQVELTLNLLQAARSNPTLSAWAYLFGQFDYNKTPLAPPGIKAIAQVKVGRCASWGQSGRSGWYIGPTLEHYRCVKIFHPKNAVVQDHDTVTFVPHVIPVPEVDLKDFLRQAVGDIVTLLRHPPTSARLGLDEGDKTRNALLELSTIFKTMEPLPPSAPPPSLPPSQSTPHPLPLSVAPSPTVPAAPSPRVAQPLLPSPPAPAVPRVLKKKQTLVPLGLGFPKTPPSTLSLHQFLTKHAPPPMRQSIIKQRYNLRSRPSNYKARAATYLLAQHIFDLQPMVNHIYDANGKRETVDTLINGTDSAHWTKSLSNEFGRLAQGNQHGVRATDTISFIPRHLVPQDRKCTYASFVCDYKPQKTEPFRIRLVVGGDKLEYNSDAGSPAASLLETKLLLNSVISDSKKGARFLSADLKDFFLATPMDNPEYMRIHWKHIPEDIRLQYKLHDIKSGDYVYVKIKKGMYGLKQAAILAWNNLVNNLALHGYRPIPHSVGMWEHVSLPTKFCLCVDDFGIKSYSQSDTDHLLNALKQHYAITTDTKGEHFCGLTIDWNYQKGYVDISMPNYVRDLLKKLQHTPSKKQYSPHPYIPFKFGQKGVQQFVSTPDNTPFLTATETTYIQSVVGSLLYYARALDHTILPALNDIGSQQAKPTENVMKKCKQLLDYVATYPNVAIRFHASDMVLHIHSDAAYLVMPKARSRIAGYFYFDNKTTKLPLLNGALLVECKTLRRVVCSAAEAELSGVFHNAQTAVPIRHLLISLGHSQPPTPLVTDNSTAHGFVHKNIIMKRSKAWDMNYFWLRDQEAHDQIDVQWDKGINNDSDYHTKHHPGTYHINVRPRYVIDRLNLITQNICDKLDMMTKSSVRVRGCVSQRLT